MKEIIGGLGFGFAFLAIITGSMLLVGICIGLFAASLVIK